MYIVHTDGSDEKTESEEFVLRLKHKDFPCYLVGQGGLDLILYFYGCLKQEKVLPIPEYLPNPDKKNNIWIYVYSEHYAHQCTFHCCIFHIILSIKKTCVFPNKCNFLAF